MTDPRPSTLADGPPAPAGTGFEPAPPATNGRDAPSVEPPRDLADCIRLLAVAERDAQAQAEEASGLRAQADERDRLAAALSIAEAERDAVLTSTSWRITAPLRLLAERLARARARRRGMLPMHSSGSDTSVSPLHRVAAGDEAPAMLPPTFPEPCSSRAPRVSLLLDRLAVGDDSEDVAVLVLLALSITREKAARLRILTRLRPAEPAALDDLLRRYGLDCVGNPGFDWLAPTECRSGLGIGAAERAVVGCWNNARIACALFAPRRVIYVVDHSEVAYLTGSTGRRHAQALFAGACPTLVFTGADVPAALHGTGLLAPSERECPAGPLTLSDQPWSPDWHRAVDQFVRDWLTT